MRELAGSDEIGVCISAREHLDTYVSLLSPTLNLNTQRFNRGQVSSSEIMLVTNRVGFEIT